MLKLRQPILTLALSLASLLVVSATTSAAPVYDVFGPLPALQAGGSINQNVAIANSVSGLTLGLTAQQRYFNPALTNNGAGTFFAGTGQNNGLGSSAYQGALWNFNFYIQNTSMNVYTYTLFYGQVGGPTYSFNPALDTDAYAFAGSLQDSQNLLFSNFGGAPNAFSGTFDPNANADYQFLLQAFDINGTVVAQSGIVVRVGTGNVPEGGSTLALLSLALGGAAFFRRKLVA